MRVGATTTGGLQVILHDRDAKELIRPLDGQSPIHQQDTLALVAVDCGISRDVNDREVVTASAQGVYTVAPVQEVGLITARRATKVRVGLVRARSQRNGGARRQLGIRRPAEGRKTVVVDARVVDDRRIPLDRAVTTRADVGTGVANA